MAHPLTGLAVSLRRRLPPAACLALAACMAMAAQSAGPVDVRLAGQPSAAVRAGSLMAPVQNIGGAPTSA